MWAQEDINRLKEVYLSHDRDELLAMFPGHSWRGIKSKARKLGMQREYEEWVVLCCAYCQKTYSVKPSHSTRSTTNYCSRECYRKGSQSREIVECLACNKKFAVHLCRAQTVRFCSAGCKLKYKRVTLICKNCNKPFEIPRSSAKSIICCSSECSKQYHVGEHVYNYKGNSIVCTCLWCGSEFQLPEAWVKKGGGKFCSASCRSRHNICKQGGMVSSIELAVKDELEKLNEVYHHQYRIDRFLVDFYLPQRNLVIECDGAYWHSLEKNQKNDVKKNAYMAKAHINLARLPEADIKRDCHTLIAQTLSQYPLI